MCEISARFSLKSIHIIDFLVLKFVCESLENSQIQSPFLERFLEKLQEQKKNVKNVIGSDVAK